MNLEKMIGSGKYGSHVIEEARLLSEDRTDWIQIEIVARDDDDRYKKSFRLSFFADEPKGQEMLGFLAGGKGKISLEEVSESLIGKKYLTLNIEKSKTGPKVDGIDYDESTMLLDLSPDFANEVLHDGKRCVDVGNATAELIEYSPVKPFRDFAEEKEFRRQYSRNRVWQWGGENYLLNIEEGVRKAVEAINKFVFAYANGWSHSGTPKDHKGIGAKFGGEDFDLSWLENKSDVPAPDHAGYIIFRADESNPDYKRFEEDAAKIKGVSINPAKDSYGNKILIVKVDEDIIRKRDIDEYQKHLEGRWEMVLEVMERYVQKQRGV